jgi:hypothetical protein
VGGVGVSGVVEWTDRLPKSLPVQVTAVFSSSKTIAIL